jgi:hypothetical protein
MTASARRASTGQDGRGSIVPGRAPAAARRPRCGAGVIDWDAAARGDRRLDLVTLRFGAHAITADPAATARLDQVLDDIPGHVLTPMWAHMSLRMTDWAIRHFTPDDVSHWLDLAEQRVR